MANAIRSIFYALIFISTGVLAEVTIDTPWVRGTVSGQTATGAFMDLKSGTDLTLIRVSSPLAKTVELHTMETQDGIMKMHAIKRLPVPAGKTVRLAPGGYHLMLIGLKQTLNNSDSVPITLTFEDAKKKKQTLEVKAQVRGLGVTPAKPP